MTKYKYLLMICCVLALMPAVTFAEGDEPGDTPIDCVSDETCTSDPMPPYVPSECELRMWDVYAAADLAVQDILKLPICEELVSSWIISDDLGGGSEAYNSVNNFVDNTLVNSNEQTRRVKKVIVSKRKLKNLQRKAKLCK